MRPERPLTRRELRERERAVEAEQGNAGAIAAMFETPAAGFAQEPAPAIAQAPVAPVVTPAVAAPSVASAPLVAAAPAMPVAPAAPAPVAAPATAAAPVPAPVAPARATAFDALFDDLLAPADFDEHPAATSTRPIVLPEASVAPEADATRSTARVTADAVPAETRRSRGATEPARRGAARRRGGEVPTAPRGRDASTRPGNAAFAATSPTKAAAQKPSVRRRAARMTTLVAMSFAALLVVATSVPSLSLLSAADVQAMALAGSDSGREPGQSLDTSGDAIASPSVGLESYKSQTISEYAEAAGIRAEATFTNNPNGTIQWPFAVGVHIGDRFGYRDCAGCSSDHHGQDFNPGYGADIQAIADGVVSQSTDSGGSLGTVMMIDHVIDGEVVTSVYAHMISGSRLFEVGDTVKVGDVIGKTGNTGMSTGPHLHFEIRLGGVNGPWTDPLEWLYANTN